MALDKPGCDDGPNGAFTALFAMLNASLSRGLQSQAGRGPAEALRAAALVLFADSRENRFAADAETGVVRFENVGLRYGLGPEILRDLTFRIQPNSLQFLTGPSRAGRRWLRRLLSAWPRPSRPRIALSGHASASRSEPPL